MCPPAAGWSVSAFALIGAWGLWESDNWIWALQVHIMAETAAAEEFSSLCSAHQAFLQLSIYPTRVLQNSSHPVTAPHHSVPPSAHSLPLCQPASSHLVSGFGGGPCSGAGKLLCAQRGSGHPTKQMPSTGDRVGWYPVWQVGLGEVAVDPQPCGTARGNVTNRAWRQPAACCAGSCWHPQSTASARDALWKAKGAACSI